MTTSSTLAILLLSAMVCAAIGVGLALCRARRIVAVAASVLTFSVSILITYWEHLVRGDPNWASNLLDGVFHTGFGSFVVHALPVLVGYCLTKWLLQKCAAKSQHA